MAQIQWRGGQTFVDGRSVDVLVDRQVVQLTELYALDPTGVHLVVTLHRATIELPDTAPVEPPWWQHHRPRYDDGADDGWCRG
jgi:hypothetical protein